MAAEKSHRIRFLLLPLLLAFPIGCNRMFNGTQHHQRGPHDSITLGDSLGKVTHLLGNDADVDGFADGSAVYMYGGGLEIKVSPDGRVISIHDGGTRLEKLKMAVYDRRSD